MSGISCRGMSFPLTRTSLALILAVLGLAGCASKPSYVVLLANDDGSIGKVQVTGRDGTTLLEKDREGTVIGGPTGKTFIVGEESMAKDFGAAMAASPQKPQSFLLYFETGGAKLTRESEASIPGILEEIGRRPAPDISIIGHTDTVGGDEENTRLGLTRARSVAGLIDSARLRTVSISVESHGEKNLLVATPDNTAEPRNRRVEVTVR